MIVRAAHPSHYPWLIERVGCAVTRGFRALEAVDAEGCIHGMVGYDNWTATSVFLHIALTEPIAFRSLIVEDDAGNRCPVFSYPFLQGGREVALATVRESNKASRRLVEHVGFRLGWNVKDGIAFGEDLLFYEMRRKDCRWLKPARS